MKFKILLQAILLILLITPASYAQTPMELRESLQNDYGIELTRSYPGSIVLELLQAAEAEIEAAVTEAFEEGYKAAMVQYMPELAVLQIREEALRMQLEREQRKNRFFWPTAGATFAAGFLLSSLVMR